MVRHPIVYLAGLLWGLQFDIVHIKGQTLTLDGPTSAVQGTSYQFTCTLTGGILGLTLPFVRGTGSSADTPCIVNTRTCQEHLSVNGYSCACVSGENRKYYLNISSVSLQDGDNWQCGYSGVLSNNINVVVQYPPIITSVPSNKDVTENNSPNIDCSSNITPGNPSTTSYRWTGPGGYSKTGAVLDRTVTRTQGGQYTCTATNTAGLSDTAHVNINVQYPPIITSVPSNKDVTENTSPNIDCSSNITPGNPSSTSYRWTGPGGYSKTGAVLDRTVTRTWGGQYTCTATNTAGLSDTAQVNINVQYGPSSSVVITPASPHTVNEGSGPLTVRCTADCNPVCAQTFRKGGNPVGQGQVILTSVNRSHAGDYICEVGNGIGSKSSRTFTLFVQYLDYPTMSISPQDVMENASVNLNCSVLSNPSVQMTIRNVDNKTNLVDQDLTNSRQYVIEKAQCLHNGTYQCVVKNSGIPLTETVVTSLNVKCAPRHDYRKNITYTVAKKFNETATMVADVIANPLPHFTWWRYDSNQLVPISNSTIYSVHSTDLQSVLQVNVSRSSDYGKYALQMENSVDTKLIVFVLTAKSSPDVPTNLTVMPDGPNSLLVAWRQENNGGAKQTFTVEYSKDGITWIIAGTMTESQTKEYLQLIISNLEPSTSYYVRMIARNIYGEKTYTKHTIGLTTEMQKTPVPPSSNVGVIVGATIGCVFVLVIITGIAVYLMRKGFRCVLLTPDMEAVKKRSSNDTSRSMEGHSTLSTGSRLNFAPNPNPYSELNREGDKQTYTELKTYVNIEQATESAPQNTYETIQKETEVPYQDIRIPIYINAAF